MRDDQSRRNLGTSQAARVDALVASLRFTVVTLVCLSARDQLFAPIESDKMRGSLKLFGSAVSQEQGSATTKLLPGQRVFGQKTTLNAKHFKAVAAAEHESSI